MNMKAHPVAELFPMLGKIELDELVESIKSEGLLHPCVRQGDLLLDGRNRLEACKIAGVEPKFVDYEGESPVGFIIAANLKRRNLDKGQKIALALEIEPHFSKEARRKMSQAGKEGGKVGGRGRPQVKNRGVENVPHPYSEQKKPAAKARDEAASAVGISGKLVTTAKAIKQEDPELFEKIKDGKISVARAKKELKEKKDKADLKTAQQQISSKVISSFDSVCDLRCCSCEDLFASGIKPDVVITDPPYPFEFLHTFTELAKGCALAGVPVVAVMSGQSYLPEVMRRLCEHLKYRWTLAYLLPGGQAVQEWRAKVNTSWKPILLFGDSVEWFGDVAKSSTNDNDKRFHQWGQSESGMADLITRLTKPGQLVCDPFLGGGTTAVACYSLGRRFVGCDIDSANVEQTRERVVSAANMGFGNKQEDK
jgi:hypothetical protein